MELTLQPDHLLTVFTAIALGGVIGFERQLAERPAGFRTHMLVAGAAALMVILGDLIVSRFVAEEAQGTVRTDPLRVFEAILVGVSFLGAGTIFRRNGDDHVQGLTTAASLLFVAALGIAVALDQELLAIALTLMLLVIMRLALWLEKRMGLR